MPVDENACYVPVETKTVYAWQLDVFHLEKLARCFGMLEYCKATVSVFRTTSAARVGLVVKDQRGAAHSVFHHDWIVVEDEEVRTVSREAFAASYRKHNVEVVGQ